MTKQFFRNCQGALAVFDICVRETFREVEDNIKEYRTNCPWEYRNNIVLVGNKVD